MGSANTFTRRRQRMILDLPTHILERLRVDGPMSRVELARRIGVGAASVGNYVGKMMEAGLLLERTDSASAYVGKGRPPTLLDLNPAGGVMVGVDVEGFSIRAVLFDFTLHVLKEVIVTLPEQPDERRFERVLLGAIEKVRPLDETNWLGIGIAFPGMVDAEKGIAVECGLFKKLANYPMPSRVREHFGRPTFVDNDMCCIANGEHMAGQGRDVNYFCCVAARAGWFGAAIFANGELTSGPQRGLNVGEWLLPIEAGEMPARFHRARQDGRVRCRMNDLLSEEGLVASFDLRRRSFDAGSGGEALPECEDFDDFCDLVLRKEPVALAALHPVEQALGRVLARIDDILCFERIVLDGILIRFGLGFLDRVHSHYLKFTMGDESRLAAFKLSFSELGDCAGATGAAGLVLRNWQPAVREEETV